MAALSRTATLLARITRRSGEPAEPAGPDPPQPTREQRSSEEKRLEGQARLAGIVDSAMDAIVTVDSSQRILLFNRSAERMFGCTANQAIGLPLDRFIPERFRAVHARHIESFGRTGVAMRSMGAARAVHGLRSNGEEFPLEASISQVGAGGQKLYTVILRDISERMNAEERFRQVIESSPHGVVMVDRKGTLVLVNERIEAAFGYARNELLGKPIEMLVPGRFQAHHAASREEYITHPTLRPMGSGRDLYGLRKDGSEFPVEIGLNPLQTTNGTMVLGTIVDITERKQAEREISRLNAELEQRVADRTAQLEAANRELDAFSYSVSHDLRAPLRHINGFSQALLEDYPGVLDELGKSYLNELRGASQEMARLIDDLLQLSKVTRSEMSWGTVDLSGMARSILGALQKGDTGRRVTIDIEAGISARGDRRLLRVVLSNLLENAWKFTSKREHAEIAFGVDRDASERSYFVRDNGAGFDMAYASKLFGPFQRLHAAREFEGTGIGLATVQRIVSRHRGRVWARAALNEGATFHFTLPD